MIARCLLLGWLLCVPCSGQERDEAKIKEERAVMEKELYPIIQEADEVVLYSLYPVAKKDLENEPDRSELGVAFGVGQGKGPAEPSAVDKKVAALARKAELFEGFPILGREAVTDPKHRAEVLAAILNAMLTDAEDPASADCFDPRHGVLVRKGEVRLRFTICFACSYSRLGGAPGSAQAGAKIFNHFRKDFADFLNARFKAAGLVHPPYKDFPTDNE